MFKFIKSITGRREAERADFEAAIERLVAQGLTEEQAFAKLHMSGTAAETMADIRVSKRGAGLITKLALAVSLPHQIGYFLSLAKPHFEADMLQWTHPISIISGAIIVPCMFDLAILFFVRHLTMKVAAISSKWIALVMLTIPASGSAYVNFTAPSPARILNYVFGGAVLFIPLIHGYRAFFKTNFRQLVEERAATLAQVATPEEAPVAGAPRRKMCQHEIDARKVSNYSRKNQANKQKWTAEWKASHVCVPDNVKDLLDMQDADAPVSGSPVNA